MVGSENAFNEFVNDAENNVKKEEWEVHNVLQRVVEGCRATAIEMRDGLKINTQIQIYSVRCGLTSLSFIQGKAFLSTKI